MEKSRKKYVKSMEEDYGKNFSRSLQVVDSEEISEKELSKIKDSLRERYDIAPSRVQSARTLILKITLQGSDNSRVTAGVIDAIKIDSQWYLIFVAQHAEGYRVSFLTSASLNELLIF